MLLTILLLLSDLREMAVSIKTKGDVKVIRATEEMKLTRGMILKEGDEIRTGENGYALIKYLEKGIIIEVKSHSSISIPIDTRSRRTGRLRRLKLFFGEIISIIKGKSFEVETPNAVAAVRGTKFSVTHSGDTTRVFVISGSVKLKNESGEIDINPGEGGICVGDNPPVKTETPKKIQIEFEHGSGNIKILEIEVE